MSENEKLVAVSDNGKRWRVVPEDNDWEMVVVGHVTAGQAEKICRRIAEQAAALTAAEARIKGLVADLHASRMLVDRRTTERDKEAERADGNYFAYQGMIRERDALALSILGGNADDR